MRQIRKKRFRIFNIEWDCEDPKRSYANNGVKLSDLTDFEIICEIIDDDEVADELTDIVSDWSGWCHYGFNFKELEYKN